MFPAHGGFSWLPNIGTITHSLVEKSIAYTFLNYKILCKTNFFGKTGLPDFCTVTSLSNKPALNGIENPKCSQPLGFSLEMSQYMTLYPLPMAIIVYAFSNRKILVWQISSGSGDIPQNVWQILCKIRLSVPMHLLGTLTFINKGVQNPRFVWQNKNTIPKAYASKIVPSCTARGSSPGLWLRVMVSRGCARTYTQAVFLCLYDRFPREICHEICHTKNLAIWKCKCYNCHRQKLVLQFWHCKRPPKGW